jgi:hypothetical protein
MAAESAERATGVQELMVTAPRLESTARAEQQTAPNLVNIQSRRPSPNIRMSTRRKH